MREWFGGVLKVGSVGGARRVSVLGPGELWGGGGGLGSWEEDRRGLRGGGGGVYSVSFDGGFDSEFCAITDEEGG